MEQTEANKGMAATNAHFVLVRKRDLKTMGARMAPIRSREIRTTVMAGSCVPKISRTGHGC